MATWTNDELNKVGSAEELQISGLRPDGTLRDRVTIWVVRIGDDLYVRSAKGHSGIWYNKASSYSQRSYPGWRRGEKRFICGNI